MILYLASTHIEYDWRKFFIDEFHKNKFGHGHEFICPVLTSNPVIDIVIKDKQNILRSDILIAYIEKSTFGTTMEIMYAFDHLKLVYIINPNELYHGDIWLYTHSHGIFKDFESCITRIKQSQSYHKSERL